MKLLKAVWNLKRETFKILAKLHCKNILVIGPMKVLGMARTDYPLRIM
jgi:hypothetical protein